MYKFQQTVFSPFHCDIIIVQMKDVFDGNRLVVGPYDWSYYAFLKHYINYPNEYFRRVNLCLSFILADDFE